MIAYCIEHEAMVNMEQGVFCSGHPIVLFNDPEIGLSSFDFCCMTPDNYAFCAPPEFDMDLWLEQVVEPSDQELREIEETQEDFE